ncbi:WD40/YVTN/BNR-like repeat-containing protein [Luteibaculum oceani]|uniref:Photosynthesis system II assembly factor Ycf48/Hcf136-like domain-containing protein n=1 Tax=Luteibaculum oceani TaxID=1294296 RepID=A0A5C6V4V1_9FLAO|nr:YCF48-related protein [Luteibaculum oceani]TXC78808.1 hypothetical protein FRX97_06245 [Luteibaculum oceani]
MFLKKNISIPSLAILILLIGTIIGCGKGEPMVQNISIPDDISFRGISISEEGEIWLSGSKGTILYKSQKGAEWSKSIIHPEAEIRCIKALDNSTAIACSATEPAAVFKTSDKGKTWNKVFEDSTAFFDALVMDSAGLGYILADPMNGRFKIYQSKDFGNSWTAIPDSLLPEAGENEYAFAASNQSAIQIKNGLIFVTGGASGAFIHAGIPTEGKWKKEHLALNAGEACGAFSLVRKGDDLMLGGGCYNDISNSERNMLFSDNLGTQWFSLPKGPVGYISSMAFLGDKYLFSAGDLGLQYALPRYRKFVLIKDTEGLNAITCNNQFCIAAGKKGKILWVE